MAVTALIDGAFPEIPEVRNGFSARWSPMAALEQAAIYLTGARKLAYPGLATTTGVHTTPLVVTWQVPRLWYAGPLEVRGFFYTGNTGDDVEIKIEDGAFSTTIEQRGTVTNAAADAVEFNLYLETWSASGALADFTTTPIDLQLTLTPSNLDSAVTAGVAPISAHAFVHVMPAIEVG